MINNLQPSIPPLQLFMLQEKKPDRSSTPSSSFINGLTHGQMQGRSCRARPRHEAAVELRWCGVSIPSRCRLGSSGRKIYPGKLFYLFDNQIVIEVFLVGLPTFQKRGSPSGLIRKTPTIPWQQRLFSHPAGVSQSTSKPYQCTSVCPPRLCSARAAR